MSTLATLERPADLQQLAGQRLVIKYGGSAIGEGAAAVCADIVALRRCGARPIVVHGGGKAISGMLDKLQVPVRWVDGLRVTDQAVLDVAEMVLIGQVNKQLVSELQRQGGDAIGLSGVDCRLLVTRPAAGHGDLGFVGDVAEVNTSLLDMLVDRGYVPVIAPIGTDDAGQHYNVNADSAAAAVAGAIQADRLILMTDVPGVYRDVQGSKVRIPLLTPDGIDRLIAEGQIKDGMIPKLTGCLRALNQGVGQVHIIDGRSDHPLVTELQAESSTGTRLTTGACA